MIYSSDGGLVRRTPKKGLLRRRMRAAPRGRGKPAAAAWTPAELNPINFYSFHDASVLWADTSATTPASDTGIVARIDNLGSDTAYMSAAGGQEANWDAGTNSGDFTYRTDGYLTSARSTGNSTGAWTVAWLGMTHDGVGGTGLQYSGNTSGFTVASFLCANATGLDVTGIRQYYGSTFYNPGNSTVDTRISTIVTSTSTGPAKKIWSSWAADFTASDSHSEIATGSPAHFGCNVQATISTTGWGGKLGAMIIWYSVLSDEDIALVQQWDTDTFGTTWDGS